MKWLIVEDGGIHEPNFRNYPARTSHVSSEFSGVWIMPFLDPLVVEWIGVRNNRNLWRMFLPLRYQDNTGDIHTIPVGYYTDGESIPVLFKAFSGQPCIRSGILHDYLGDRPHKRVEEAHKLYKEALLSEGLDEVQAEQRFAAVSFYDQRTRP